MGKVKFVPGILRSRYSRYFYRKVRKDFRKVQGVFILIIIFLKYFQEETKIIF
ncbi:hypothetical protein RCH33_1402 [Flavobacterium daejeonense]|nr:hypothetical protein RCH33_1402 [Flavobacterium daejeonense]